MITLAPSEPSEYLDPPEGLSGYWWESGIICVPIITAIKPDRFLPWLRQLEKKGKPVFFPTIINARLDKLLRLRGYVDAVVPITEMEEPVFGLVLEKKEKSS